MTEWRNIRAALLRIGGYAALMAIGAILHALATGVWV